MAARGEATKERILAAAEQLVFERGYAGTSLDEIIDKVGLTKGAFFYHFKSKADLARGILERFSRQEQQLFEQWSERASALADDPLQDVLLFFKFFEEFVDGIDDPLPGCMFASYAYQSGEFSEAMNAQVHQELTEWGELFERKFEKLIAWRKPRMPATAGELTEAAMCVIEGALLLGRVYKDSKMLVRQSTQFRNYLQLLFGAN